MVIQNPSTPPVVPPPPPPPSGGSEMKYLALGDSYTIGQGVPATESYPVQTRDWLIANGIAGISNPQIIATTGWTTTALKAAIAVANPTVPEVNAIKKELEEFVAAIVNNTRTIVSEMDVLMAMDVAHKILARIGHNVITH